MSCVETARGTVVVENARVNDNMSVDDKEVAGKDSDSAVESSKYLKHQHDEFQILFVLDLSMQGTKTSRNRCQT